MNRMRRALWGCLLLVALTLTPWTPALGQSASGGSVQSHFQGTITVRPDVDSTQNYAGFEVLVFNRATATADADTLGYAVTDRQGRFAMDLVAPRRGLYPIVISRTGTVLKVDNMVVAQDDSSRLRVRVPIGDRPLGIRSPENAAWVAYQNTQAQYNQSLLELIQAQTMTDSSMAAAVQQTASIYWNLYTTYPGTIGGALGGAEAITLLAGWDDAQAVAYQQALDADNPRLVDAVRAARKAQARVAGQAAALALVEAAMAQTDDPVQRAALQSEIVIAHMDSSDTAAAIAAAQTLQSLGQTGWDAWATDALYELQNLMPGMIAPTFTATTRAGTTLTLADLRGQEVLLEFYAPEDNSYRSERALRDSLVQAWAGRPLQVVSISMQPDTLLNEALFDEGTFPGAHIFDPLSFEGAPARAFGVQRVPTRYLLDAEGRIVQKFIGSGTWGLIRDELEGSAPDPPDEAEEP